MEVMAGVKQTELGVIPNEWNLIQLEKIADPSRKWSFTGGPFGSNLKSSDYTQDGVRVIQLQNIGDGVFYNDSEIYTSPEKANELLSCNIYPNEIILSKMGDPVARASIIPNFHDRYLMCSDGIRLSVNAKEHNNYFIFLSLNFNYFRKQAESASTGSTRKRIGLSELRQLKVICPKIDEQNAIAEALSDADALIESLEKLIEKKRQIKQGTMQELLTGKKRLPGFSGQWVMRLLNMITWYQEGPGVRSSQFTLSGIKLLNGTNIDNGTLNLDTTSRFISEQEAYGPYAHFMVEEGDIVIASSGITIDKFDQKVAFVRAENLPFCMNTSTIRFKCHSKINPDFLYHFLKSSNFKEQIGGQATGSAQLNFGPSHLDKITINLPEIEEQTAIAEILTDLDREISSLEVKLTKARGIKQGMMQQLLTGNIRLTPSA